MRALCAQAIHFAFNCQIISSKYIQSKEAYLQGPKERLKMAYFLPSPTPGTTIFRLSHFTKQSKHWVSYYFPNIPKLFPPQGTALAVTITWNSPQKQFIWLSIASPALCSKIISKMCSSNAITSTFYVLDLTYFLFTTYYYHQETLYYI